MDPVKDASFANPVFSIVAVRTVDFEVTSAVVGITVLVMIGDVFSMVDFSSSSRYFSSSAWVGSGVEVLGSRVVGTGVTTIAKLLVSGKVVVSIFIVLRLVVCKSSSGAFVVTIQVIEVSVGFTIESGMEMVTPFKVCFNGGIKIDLGLLLIWSAFLSSFSLFRTSTGTLRHVPLILMFVGGSPMQTAAH
jgi:hypothetical protein